MREEVVLEVVDHRYRLVEEVFCAATVHQYGFGSKHFGHLRQYRGSTLSDEPVGEFSHKRIGSDTRETVRATTLQSYAEFRYRNLHTLILLGKIVEFTKYRHTCFHLVFYLLGNEQFNTILIIIAQHRHEVVRLIVLTAQA